MSILVTRLLVLSLIIILLANSAPDLKRRLDWANQFQDADNEGVDYLNMMGQRLVPLANEDEDSIISRWERFKQTPFGQFVISSQYTILAVLGCCCCCCCCWCFDCIMSCLTFCCATSFGDVQLMMEKFQRLKKPGVIIDRSGNEQDYEAGKREAKLIKELQKDFDWIRYGKVMQREEKKTLDSPPSRFKRGVKKLREWFGNKKQKKKAKKSPSRSLRGKEEKTSKN